MTAGRPRLSFCLARGTLSRGARLAAAVVIVAGILNTPIGIADLLGQSRSATTSDFDRFSTAADAARHAGSLDEAVPLYRKALALRPAWQEGWWALGTILYDQDSPAEAARAFERLLALDPNNPTGHLMLALCEYQLDRFASAMEHIQAAKRYRVQGDGQLPRVMAYHEGLLLLRDGRYERAIEALQLLPTPASTRNRSRTAGPAPTPRATLKAPRRPRAFSSHISSASGPPDQAGTFS
jgi:tetratricopeptide (TPR) repeat protein